VAAVERSRRLRRRDRPVDDPAPHDRAVALTSHLPHLMAVLVAAG
jgi:prephenate dehydrogenase